MDPHILREIVAGPGVDTRQWISYGVVEARGPATGDADPVEFDPDYGPLVLVALQPSGISVRCRVGCDVAGNGEADYYPFLEGDEVLVAIPEGDERAGCVIIKRLTNQIDKWPMQVAGTDVTQNGFAFRRMRVPYLLESSDAILIRTATSGANVALSKDGRITLTDALNSFFTINPDFIGMQNGDGDVLLQLDLQDKTFVVDANGTKMTLAKDGSIIASTGTIAIAPNGAFPLQHIATVEGCVNLIAQWSFALSAAITALGGPAAAVAGAFLPATLLTAIAATPTSSLGPYAAYAAAVTAALAGKTPDTTGNVPGLGSGGGLVG